MSPRRDRLFRAFRRIGSRLTSFRNDRRGNIAVIAAVAAIPLILAAGGATDLAGMMFAKTQLQDTADAASLAAVNAANTYLATNSPNTPAIIAQAQTLAQTTAQNYIRANSSNINLASPVTPVAALTSDNSGVKVTISFTGTKTPIFLPLIGMNKMNINISSVTTAPKPSYYQIVFLVDVSNSMAIGGTQAAIDQLQTNPAINCAFACHDPGAYSQVNNCFTPAKTTTKNGKTTTTPAVNNCDFRATAKAAGIPLKIDYVNQAVQTFITQLTPYATAYPNHFTVGITTFGSQISTPLAPTTNLATATTAAQGIDVEEANANNNGYTLTTSALTSLQSLPNVGDGSSATSRVTYVIFLSDGVEDVPGSSQWGRATDLKYTTACTALKQNVKVFSIWAPYYPITNDPDGQYTTLVKPIINQLGPTMQSCASQSNYYFTANDGPSIQQAVSNTFDVIINNTGLRVSQ